MIDSLGKRTTARWALERILGEFTDLATDEIAGVGNGALLGAIGRLPAPSTPAIARHIAALNGAGGDIAIQKSATEQPKGGDNAG